MRYSSLTEAIRLLGCFGNDYEAKPRLTCASAGEGSQAEDDEEEEDAANQNGLNFQSLDTSHYFFHISSMDVEKRSVYDDDDGVHAVPYNLTITIIIITVVIVIIVLMLLFIVGRSSAIDPSHDDDYNDCKVITKIYMVIIVVFIFIIRQ